MSGEPAAADHERILGAALQVGGQTYWLAPPARHHDVIRHMLGLGLGVPSIAAAAQGFVTDAGRFVERLPALAIARRAGQARRETAPEQGLFSEDLW